MAEYVDGFVIVIAKKNLKLYKKDAIFGRRLWLKHGALDYRECLADDLDVGFGKTFKKLTGAKANQTVVFSWITYKSKAHRNAVNKKVMSDPEMVAVHERHGNKMPFKMEQMSYGGFKTFVKK